jgi:hypothetical protein
MARSSAKRKVTVPRQTFVVGEFEHIKHVFPEQAASLSKEKHHIHASVFSGMVVVPTKFNISCEKSQSFNERFLTTGYGSLKSCIPREGYRDWTFRCMRERLRHRQPHRPRFPIEFFPYVTSARGHRAPPGCVDWRRRLQDQTLWWRPRNYSA